MRIISALIATVCCSAYANQEVHPAYQLTPEMKQQLFERAATLKAGDSYSTVIERLGKPTHDERATSKQGNRLICRSLVYYAVKLDSRTVNEKHDEYVDVCLDEANNVRSITAKRKGQS